MITFESNWEKAKEVLQNIANANALSLTPEVDKELIQTSRKFLIFYNKLSPYVYTSVEDSGVFSPYATSAEYGNAGALRKPCGKASCENLPGIPISSWPIPLCAEYKNPA